MIDGKEISLSEENGVLKMTEIIDGKEIEVPDPKDGWKKFGRFMGFRYSWDKYQGPNLPKIRICYDPEFFCVYDITNEKSLKRDGWRNQIGYSDYFISLNEALKTIEKFGDN